MRCCFNRLIGRAKEKFLYSFNIYNEWHTFQNRRQITIAVVAHVTRKEGIVIKAIAGNNFRSLFNRKKKDDKKMYDS